MRKKHLLSTILWLGALSALTACSTDDDNPIDRYRPTALVTVCPGDDGSFMMQLDDNTRLVPSNLKESPFGTKEVRALVNYNESGSYTESDRIRTVHVNWIDSIRTKLPAETAGDDNDLIYGNDPIEIVRDWVTVAEDGYLTLRIRTLWNGTGARHNINLLTGTNPDNPYELELRHDANGNTGSYWGDALIAFNLNKLQWDTDNPHTITLRWLSFNGEKSTDFELAMRPDDPQVDPRGLMSASVIE